MSKRLRPLLIAALVLAGCASRPPPAARGGRTGSSSLHDLQKEVSALSRGAEALLERQDALLWRSWTEGAPANLGSAYAGTETLFTPRAISAVESLLRQTREEPQRQALLHLKIFLAGEALAQATSEETQAQANLEASLAFSEGGRDLPYRELPKLLALEPKAERRKALFDAATPAVERLSQTLRRKHQRTRTVVRALGYPSYVAFGAEVQQMDPAALSALAEGLIAATQAAYETVLDRVAREELGVGRSALTAADLPRLFRPSVVDDYFPRDKAVLRLAQVSQGLGMDLSGLKHLTLDTEPRPGKHPRPLTLGLRVPGDVRLSVKPAGGLRAEAAAMHELGHALFLTHVGNLPFELSKLGAGSVAEAYGFLFEDLLSNPHFLEETVRLTGQRQGRHLAVLAVQRLHHLRRDAARLLYELRVQDEVGDDERTLYRELFSRALAIPFDDHAAARYEVDRDELFGAARSFRAYFLAAQLALALEERFGDAWWRSAEAGDFLERLWLQGNTPTPRGLAQQLGAGGIRREPLLARLGSALGAPLSEAPLPDPSPPAGSEGGTGGNPE